MPDHYRTNLGWKVLTNVDFSDVEENSKHKTLWHYLSSKWRNEFPDEELWQMEKTTYVISISSPFSFEYKNSHSPVIYIGEGFAHARFKEHIQEKILPLIQDFRGAKFDFWVLRSDDKYEIVATECRMLRQFETQYGSKPLFNRQNGKDRPEPPHPAWFQPLDGRRIGKRHWAIRRLD